MNAQLDIFVPESPDELAALSTNERLRLAGYHTTCPLADNERTKREVRDESGEVVFVGNAGAVTSWLEAQGR